MSIASPVSPASHSAAAAAPSDDTRRAVIAALVERHGESVRSRAETGVRQVATRWQHADGDADALREFCLTHFVVKPDDLAALRDRMEAAITTLYGHLYEVRRHLRVWSDLRPVGGEALRAFDGLFAKIDPAPDLTDQMHRQGLAFAALLNFEKPDLDTMLRRGGAWTADEWTDARIAQSFGPRIPGALNDHARDIRHRADKFVSEFHIPVGTLIDERGKRWLEPGRKLIAHWLIREQIRAHYGEPDGLSRQRALMHVMRRAIEGTVPRSIMAGTEEHDWDSAANTLAGKPVTDVNGPQRYEHLLAQFHLAQKFDVHYPDHPTAIARKFDLEREMSETGVEQLMLDLLASPVRRKLADLMRQRLGRPLEAHDIYFDEVSDGQTGAELDVIVTKRFPDEAAFEKALPDILRTLGFSSADADFLGGSIRVEIARGAGHAMRPGLPEYGAWLRTNRLDACLGWDGFDTAMHELGHNLEQLVSTHHVARPMLRGVPNTACTEAFAFLYQSLGMRVLDVNSSDDAAKQAGDRAIQTMLSACQIAGPSLVELYTWRWLYAHPGATAGSLRDEMLRIAADLWGRFYEEDFGADPYHTLAAYQHMIAYPLYLADYTLGHIISHQIRSFLSGRDPAAETLRICAIGRLTPDAWMRQAVGDTVSIEPLLKDVAAAV